MVAIRVRLEGGEELHRALADSELVAGPVKDMVAEAAFIVEAKAKALAPVDRGRLRASITSEIAPLEAQVYTNVMYAPMVELGTKPHVILPKNKKALAFQLGGKLGRGTRRRGRTGMIGGGAKIVVAKVNHPGTRPHPFMLPAAEALVRQAPRLLQRLARAIEAHWGRGR